MRITVNGTPHQVDFRHWRPRSSSFSATYCYFDATRTPGGGLLIAGYAECSPKDTFRKATGRKVSLARALEARGYHKAWRTAFWEAYFRQAQQ